MTHEILSNSNSNWSHPPYAFLIAAITLYSKGVLTDERLMGEARVEFRVNGVDLPFEATMLDLWRRSSKHLDNQILRKAQELVDGASLAPLREKLEQMDREISELLREALDKQKADKPPGGLADQLLDAFQTKLMQERK